MDDYNKYGFNMQVANTAMEFARMNDQLASSSNIIAREKARKEELESNHRKTLEEEAKKQSMFLEEISQKQQVANSKLKNYDVFVSHATENKCAYVNKLRTELKKTGANVWYDVDCIGWGDSLSNTIDDGLKNCSFGIVVLSKEFFEKPWCQKELTALIERQKTEEDKVILPLLYDISIKDATSKCGDIADLLAIDCDKYKVKDVAILFAKVLIKRLKSVIEQENSVTV